MTTDKVKAAYRIGTTGAVTTFALAGVSVSTSAWASGGWCEVSSANMPGIYRLDVPDAAFASTPAVTVTLNRATTENFAPVAMAIPIVNSNGSDWPVNVKQINGVSASSVTAVKNVIGLDTVPTNFGSLAISSSGEVNVKTNNDKTGYSLASGAVSTTAVSTGTLTAIADTVLDRDMSGGLDSGSSSVRTPRQALRFIRNKWTISGTTMTVYKEDDVTASWTSILTGTSGADPITGSDPA